MLQIYDLAMPTEVQIHLISFAIMCSYLRESELAGFNALLDVIIVNLDTTLSNRQLKWYLQVASCIFH